MAFDKKTWSNNQAGGTPLDASGLNDLESRIETITNKNENDILEVQDMFESGLFTPVVKIGGSTSGINYDSQYGYYTVIGDLLFFEIEVGFDSTGASQGNITIDNFPYEVKDIRPYPSMAVGQHRVKYPTNYKTLFAFMIGGTKELSFRFSSDGTNTTSWLNVSHYHLSTTGNTYFRMQGFYRIERS